jgi:hypothetical protein
MMLTTLPVYSAFSAVGFSTDKSFSDESLAEESGFVADILIGKRDMAEEMLTTQLRCGRNQYLYINILIKTNSSQHPLLLF